MLKYAIIGISHPHTASLYGSLARYSDEVDCVGYADTPAHDAQDTEKKLRENLGGAVDKLKRFDDWRGLAELAPDFAVVCCDNAAAADVTLELLERGISVALEKPMTNDYTSAKRIADKVTEIRARGGKTFVAVNWPIAWFPAFNRAKELCDAGCIGRIMRVVYRSPATWGPYSYSPDGENPPIEFLARTWWYRHERGGGSLLDYACYGSALASWFFGRPALGVKAIAKNFCLRGNSGEPAVDVEDYSAMIIDYGDGVGLLEGSWSTFNCGEIPSGPVIYGSGGTIVCDRHSNDCRLYVGRSHGPVKPTEVYTCPPEPDFCFGRNIIDHIVNNKPLHPLLDVDFNTEVMRILDAGMRSAGLT